MPEIVPAAPVRVAGVVHSLQQISKGFVFQLLRQAAKAPHRMHRHLARGFPSAKREEHFASIRICRKMQQEMPVCAPPGCLKNMRDA